MRSWNSIYPALGRTSQSKNQTHEKIRQKRRYAFGIRRITVCRNGIDKPHCYGSYNPKFTLTGKWLWESGFKAGDKLALKVYDKKIVIEVDIPAEVFYAEPAKAKRSLRK